MTNPILKALSEDPNIAAEFRAALPVGHTPGPWRALISNDDGGGWRQQKQTITIESDDAEVLIANYSTEFAEYPNDATNIANARLIAAAPELLAELRKCIRLIDGEVPASAIAAIAKATT